MIAIDLWALLVFSLAAQFTPGPNNIMLANTGVNFGYIRGIPHMLGILVGVLLLMLMIGFGIDLIVQAVPDFLTILRWGSLAVLLWLGWRIAVMPPPTSQDASGRPIRFIEALLFQFVNAKAWVMVTSMVSLFVTDAGDLRQIQLLWLLGVFFLLTIGSTHAWLLGGIAIRRLLTEPWHYRLFNVICGATLALCAAYVVLESD